MKPNLDAGAAEAGAQGAQLRTQNLDRWLIFISFLEKKEFWKSDKIWPIYRYLPKRSQMLQI